MRGVVVDRVGAHQRGMIGVVEHAVGRGRIALHYYVFSQNGTYGSRIGIDSVSIAGSTACPFTEMIFLDGFDRNNS